MGSTSVLSDYGNYPALTRAFREADCRELAPRFQQLLATARNGDASSGAEVLVVARKLAPFVPSPKGRSLAPETALHESFLLTSGDAGGRRGYTYGLVPGVQDKNAPSDFVDAATAATRIELARPWFNPTAARQALRARLEAEAAEDRL